MRARASLATIPGMPHAIDMGEDRPLGPIAERSRNFVVVMDDSEESRLALRFAAGRAAHIEGGGVILFHAIPPGDFQHWVAVAERMREEAIEEAQAMLEQVAARIYAYSGIKPEIALCEGEPKEALLDFIKKRDDLFALVLAASAGEDPGPLVRYFSGPLVASLPCPVVIVPGTLDPESIDRLV
ncbi:MAG: universal stress protein [Rhodothalassiaceae bacterium]